MAYGVWNKKKRKNCRACIWAKYLCNSTIFTVNPIYGKKYIQVSVYKICHIHLLAKYFPFFLNNFISYVPAFAPCHTNTTVIISACIYVVVTLWQIWQLYLTWSVFAYCMLVSNWKCALSLWKSPSDLSNSKIWANL